jgi:general secretion pathway protein C
MARGMGYGAGLLAFFAAGALGYGGGQLFLTLTSSELRQAQPVEVDTSRAEANADAADVASTEWPTVFGTYVPDKPVVTAAPKASVKYNLVGLLAGTENPWAIVGSPQGDTLVVIGDALPGGETVEEIDAQGVWITRGDQREVIGFAQSSADAVARIMSTGPLEPLQADVPLAAFKGRDMRRVLGRAGSIRMVAPRGGTGVKYPEILWVREGQLYDLIGLRRGDMILRVNGHSVADPKTLENAESILKASDEIAVEILRLGRPQTINVTINGNG